MNVSFGRAKAVHTNQLSLYIPNKDKHGTLIDPDDWINRARYLLTRCFGGCTTTYAEGMWRNEENEYIKERTALITAVVTHSDLNIYMQELRRFIQDFLFEANQNAVAIEYNGIMHFVYAEPRQNRTTQPRLASING